MYGGEMHCCVDDQGADGICVREREGIQTVCRSLCAASGPLCDDGEWFESLAVSDRAPVCYCEPAPCHHSGTCN